MQTSDCVYVRVLGFPDKFLASLPSESSGLYAKEVLVQIDHGEYLGFVNSFPFIPAEPLTSGQVIREIEPGDRARADKIERKSIQLREEVRSLVKELGLMMKITHVLLSLDESRSTIFYTAPHRIDFRELVRCLRSSYKFKATLKQISEEEREACFHTDPRIL